MRSAAERQRNGALICETRDAKRLVFFEGGQIVGAKSSLVDERLGEVIVRMGRITRAQLEEATRHIRSGRMLGGILVELGYLRGGEIESAVRTQIIEIGAAILVSTPTRLLFSDKVTIEAVTLSPVSVGEVFLDAVKRLPEIGLYRENILIDDYVLARTPDTERLGRAIKLSEAEARVLDSIDSEHTVEEILRLSPLAEDETLRILVALQQSGILAVEQRSDTQAVVEERPSIPVHSEKVEPLEKELIEVYSSIQCQNHWQVLGLERGASYLQIDRAYRARTERFAPENFQHIPDTELQEKLSFVHARLEEAFVTLSSTSTATAYGGLVEREDQYQETKERWEVITAPPHVPNGWTRPLDSEESERLLKRAKRALREQDYWRAIELLRASIELSDGTDPERFHLLGQALAENPRWRQDAEQNLKIAQNLKPWEPRYLVSLAKLYEKEGLHQRAQRIYEQIQAIDPGYTLRQEFSSEESESARTKAG
ncbi:MAG TPA: tetratricopeptide repeat protein [Vicinamibacteria bacterium]|nr:tetratricopeptide repeat protein [Vicinamibacteria bacterium]